MSRSLHRLIIHAAPLCLDTQHMPPAVVCETCYWQRLICPIAVCVSTVGAVVHFYKKSFF